MLKFVLSCLEHISFSIFVVTSLVDDITVYID